jgi:hypothetical protein
VFGKVTGSYDANRFIANTSLNAIHTIDSIDLLGFVGYTRSREAALSYVDSQGSSVNPSATLLGQVAFGGEVAYNLSELVDGMQVYAGGQWEWDHLSSGPGDRNGAAVSSGLRYRADQALTVGVNVGAQLFREHDRQYIAGANLRYQF